MISSEKIDNLAKFLDTYHQAMIGKDIDRLSSILDKKYQMIHINGYIQSREEWFFYITQGTFEYYKIDVKDIVYQIISENYLLKGHILVDATIYGSRSIWPLSFELTLIENDQNLTLLQGVYHFLAAS